MVYANVEVPISLLRDCRLTPSDKLVWMIMRLDRYDHPGRKLASPTRLAERTHLSRFTIYNSLERLTATGWYIAPNPIRNHTNRNDSILVPTYLVRSGKLLPRDIVVYGLLKDVPMMHWNGKFTYLALSQYAQMSLKTVRWAIKALAVAGWIKTEQTSPYTPIRYKLANPLDVHRLEIQRRIDTYPNLGEAIGREMVVFLLKQADFEVKAMPSWLTNPKTGALLEADLYIPNYELVMEFQGDQHFRETEFSSADNVAKQQARDVEKALRINDLKKKFLVLTTEDLSLKIIQDKLHKLEAPLRDLEGLQLIMGFLDNLGRNYQKATQRYKEQSEMKKRAEEWAKVEAAQAGVATQRKAVAQDLVAAPE